MIGAVIARKPLVMESVDYGSILLIVYAAFSQGVVNGLWHEIDAAKLVRLTLVSTLLAAVITILTFANRRLGFSRADEITIVFCGSKKSLANGVPIATLLFAGQVGLVILTVKLHAALFDRSFSRATVRKIAVVGVGQHSARSREHRQYIEDELHAPISWSRPVRNVARGKPSTL